MMVYCNLDSLFARDDFFPPSSSSSASSSPTEFSHLAFPPRSVLPITPPRPPTFPQNPPQASRVTGVGGGGEVQNWKRGGRKKKQTGVQVCDV